MSKLEFYCRPLVAFDPTNKDHRRWYYDFINNRSWGKCPVRFICPAESGLDLTVMIKDQMNEYYIRKEFELTKRVARKAKKMVDKRTKR